MKQTIIAALTVSFGILSLVAFAQLTGADAFVNWSQKNIARINTVDPGAGASDLRGLKPVIGQARIVALGETHGTHELLRLRNRLFQYLVEELDFTAIAVETGVTESMLAEDFVMGSAIDSKSAARSVFSNNRTIAYVENFELIDWMRRHNSSLTPARKIHFYGLDMSGQINGDFVQSRMTLDAALSYLRRVDSDLAAQFQKRLDPFLPKFFETFGEPRVPDYRTLNQEERDTLTSTIADLIGLFERHRIEFSAASTEHEYLAGYRNAVAARQLDNHFRVRPEAKGSNPLDFREAASARDSAMSENALWALAQGGWRGRLFVYAAMGHVHRGPQKADVRFFPQKPPLWMGQYLDSRLGNDLFVFGTAYRQADEALKLGAIDPGSFVATLARIGTPLFALNLRSVPKVGAAADWLNKTQSVAGYDGFIMVDRISPAQLMP
jgi:erythromycin esterase